MKRGVDLEPWLEARLRAYNRMLTETAKASVAPAAGYRECEGCGRWKSPDEMGTGFLPGTGETYQCEECRGFAFGTPGCAGTEEPCAAAPEAPEFDRRAHELDRDRPPLFDTPEDSE